MNKTAAWLIIGMFLLSAASLFAFAQEYEYVSLDEKVAGSAKSVYGFFKGGGYDRHKNFFDNLLIFVVVASVVGLFFVAEVKINPAAAAIIGTAIGIRAIYAPENFTRWLPVVITILAVIWLARMALGGMFEGKLGAFLKFLIIVAILFIIGGVFFGDFMEKAQKTIQEKTGVDLGLLSDVTELAKAGQDVATYVKNANAAQTQKECEEWAGKIAAIINTKDAKGVYKFPKTVRDQALKAYNQLVKTCAEKSQGGT